MIEAAERAAALLAGRSAEIEAARRLPRDLADGLAALGLMRLLTPRSCGGPELHPAEFFRVVERVARADASAAWCSFISSTSALVAAWLPAGTAAPLFGRAHLKCAGVFAPRGRAAREGSGYVVSGRWAWGSGVQHADVVVVGCLVPGADGAPEKTAAGAPRVLSVVVDAAHVKPLDNWTSFGLCGTGSGEFDIAPHWVPAERTASMLDTPPVVDTALYRFPVFGLLALAIAATASGIARQALDAFVALAASKVPQGSPRTLAQRPAVHEALARAEAQWRAARAFALEAVDEAWREAAADPAPGASGTTGTTGTPGTARSAGTIGLQARRDLRLAATHVAHGAAAVVDRVHALAGGDAIFAASPLQRCLRDVHVATQHLMVGEPTFELAGRLLLGQPTDATLL
ncbi:MAG: acyl-CoA dehydrogenase family protein [Pseudomonadota bacterium]